MPQATATEARTQEARREGGLLQILNSGYKKGAKVQRMFANKDAEDGSGWDVKEYKVAGFKCFASTYTIPDTLRSRCLTIRMRKTRKRYPMRFDEDRGKLLKIKLFKWREQLNDDEGYWTITDELEENLFEVSGHDGRLVEVFAPIYVAAPYQMHPTLREYLHDLGDAEIQEELASFECQIFEAILKADITNSMFATVDVRDKFNEGKSDREKVKTRTIGRVIKQLGFKPHRSGARRGYRWNQQLVDKLKERYQVENDC